MFRHCRAGGALSADALCLASYHLNKKPCLHLCTTGGSKHIDDTISRNQLGRLMKDPPARMEVRHAAASAGSLPRHLCVAHKQWTGATRAFATIGAGRLV